MAEPKKQPAHEKKKPQHKPEESPEHRPRRPGPENVDQKKERTTDDPDGPQQKVRFSFPDLPLFPRFTPGNRRWRPHHITPSRSLPLCSALTIFSLPRTVEEEKIRRIR